MKWVLGVLTALAVTGLGYQALYAQGQPAAPPAVQVVTPCDNADEGVCGRTPGCVWLPGYKVQGGQDVPGFCRPAPRPIQSRRGTGPAPTK
jgi:hypothetical protein